MASAAKIMIIRHAEKPEGSVQGVDIGGNDGTENLTVQGWQRAGALARFFAPLSGQFQRPGIAQPQFLFASGPVSKSQKKDDGDGSKSQRPEQTITQLSQLIGVTIDSAFVKGHEAQVAAAAVASGDVVLIAWQHEDIPAIAAAIPGASGFPSPWPGTVSTSSGSSICGRMARIYSARFPKCCSPDDNYFQNFFAIPSTT